MGMTIEEIAEQCEDEPSFLQDDIYLVTPIKKHPLFTYYAVYVNEGTGLYQIKSMIENYGGKITVESQEGVGSSFSVSFTKEI